MNPNSQDTIDRPTSFKNLEQQTKTIELKNPLDGSSFENFPQFFSQINELANKLVQAFLKESDPIVKESMQSMHRDITEMLILLTNESRNQSLYNNVNGQLELIQAPQDPLLNEVKHKNNIRNFTVLKHLVGNAVDLINEKPSESTTKPETVNPVPRTATTDYPYTPQFSEPKKLEQRNQEVPDYSGIADENTELPTESDVDSLLPKVQKTELSPEDALDKLRVEGTIKPFEEKEVVPAITIEEVTNAARALIDEYAEPMRNMAEAVLREQIGERLDDIRNGFVSKEDFEAEMKEVKEILNQIKEAIENSGCLAILRKAKEGATSRMRKAFETGGRALNWVQKKMPTINVEALVNKIKNIDWDKLNSKFKEVLKKALIGAGAMGIGAGIVTLAMTNPALLTTLLGLTAKGLTVAGYIGTAGVAGAATLNLSNNAYNKVRRTLRSSFMAGTMDAKSREEFTAENNYSDFASAISITRKYDGGYNEFMSNDADSKQVKQLLTNYLQTQYSEDVEGLTIREMESLVNTLIDFLFKYYRSEDIEKAVAVGSDFDKEAYELFKKILDADATKNKKDFTGRTAGLRNALNDDTGYVTNLINSERVEQTYRSKGAVESARDLYTLVGRPVKNQLIEGTSNVAKKFKRGLFSRFFNRRPAPATP